MLGFGKKKNRDVLVTSFRGDDIDNARLNKLKDKFKTLEIPNLGPVFGIPTSDSLEVNPISINGKEFNIFTIKTDSMTEENVNNMEEQLKKRFGYTNTILIAIDQTESLEFSIVKGEQ